MRPLGPRWRPSGSVWFAVVTPADDFCEGVGHLDGVTWDRHLLDLCVHATDSSSDGTMWIVAKEKRGPNGPRHLYVITPEAVAAAE